MPSAAAPALLHVAITAATLAGLPHQTISATDEHGHTDQYSGVALRDVLTQQGVPAGEAVRGKVMVRYVIVEATDGYRVLFSLPELDGSYTDRIVLIADTRDGVAFDAHFGPYRLIVPGEKREARWVRNVSAVDVEDAPE